MFEVSTHSCKWPSSKTFRPEVISSPNWQFLIFTFWYDRKNKIKRRKSRQRCKNKFFEDSSLFKATCYVTKAIGKYLPPQSHVIRLLTNFLRIKSLVVIIYVFNTQFCFSCFLTVNFACAFISYNLCIEQFLIIIFGL